MSIGMATAGKPALDLARARGMTTDLMLVGPAALSLLLFIFAPVAVVAVLAFTDYQVGASRFAWVGMDNFSSLFTSRLGHMALLNTLVYAGIVIPLSVGGGLLVALGLHRLARTLPGVAAVLQTIYFLPVAATLVAMAVAWQMLLHPSLGPINAWIGALGGTPAKLALRSRSGAVHAGGHRRLANGRLQHGVVPCRSIGHFADPL
jgi:multiple sugar transport system permease protein